MSSRSQSRPRKRARRPAAAPRPAAATRTTRNTRPAAEKPEKVEDVELSPLGSSVDAPLGDAPAPEAAKPSCENQQCGICLDNVKEQGQLNVCPHVFCFDCIMTWSKTANTCPVCKRSFTEVRPVGADGKRPKRRRAKYQVKNKQQVWEPTREELLNAAGLGLFQGEYNSEEDESYEPDGDEVDIDDALFDAHRDLMRSFTTRYGDVFDDEEDDEDSDDDDEDSDDLWWGEVDAVVGSLLANGAFAHIAAQYGIQLPPAPAPAPAGGILPPELRDAIRHPRRFGRR